MGTFLFVCEIGAFGDAQIYKHLPLHCTVMHWFKTEATWSDVHTATFELLSQTPPVLLVSSHEEMFGRTFDIRVHVLEDNQHLIDLHNQLLAALARFRPQFVEPEFVGDGYRPHVTVRETIEFAPGMRHTSRRIWLVEIMGDKRYLTRSFSLLREN